MSQQPEPLKVILIGDSCVDEYHYGTVDRISPEAPVPVFVPEYIERRPGMAANVFENLKNLGADVIPIFGETSIKTRFIDKKTKQHLIRVDRDVLSNPLEFLNLTIPANIDAIVVSDYNKGLVTYELVEALIRTGLPVFIDTKKTDLVKFEGAFVKINHQEYQRSISRPANLIVTLGEQGAMYQNKQYPAAIVPITDVCGAGDTFLAALVYYYLNTNNIEAAIQFAIKAASITVQHIGVYAPKLNEIL